MPSVRRVRFFARECPTPKCKGKGDQGKRKRNGKGKGKAGDSDTSKGGKEKGEGRGMGGEHWQRKGLGGECWSCCEKSFRSSVATKKEPTMEIGSVRKSRKLASEVSGRSRR